MPTLPLILGAHTIAQASSEGPQGVKGAPLLHLSLIGKLPYGCEGIVSTRGNSGGIR